MTSREHGLKHTLEGKRKTTERVIRVSSQLIFPSRHLAHTDEYYEILMIFSMIEKRPQEPIKYEKVILFLEVQNSANQVRIIDWIGSI